MSCALVGDLSSYIIADSHLRGSLDLHVVPNNCMTAEVVSVP
jgi:hypothetical protein